MLNDRHPSFPDSVFVVVEQPRHEPKRIRFDPDSQAFVRTEELSLMQVRGFTGLYGWISGTGMPPGPHYDVMVVTDVDAKPGDVVEAAICGMFRRADGDHKFVAVTSEIGKGMATADLSALPAEHHAEVLRVYPHVGVGECWEDGAAARLHLATVLPTHD